MTEQRDLEMAILSYNAYLPSDANTLPTGDWEWLAEFTADDTNIGFGATVYRAGTEIVIAFRGTDPPALQDFSQEIFLQRAAGCLLKSWRPSLWCRT